MKKIITLVVVLAIGVAGYFGIQYFRNQRNAASMDELQTVATTRGNLTATVGATGSVRPNQSVTLIFQTSGTVETVNIEVGTKVQSGQSLVTLSESSLAQNIILARADLATAQRALEDLNSSGLRRYQTEQAVQTAEKAVLDTERALVRFDEKAYKDNLEKAQEDIVTARDKLKNAQENFEPYEEWDEDNSTRKTYKDRLDKAQRDYDESLRKLRSLQLEKTTAEASYALAKAQLEDAQREFQRWVNGPDPDEVANLEARIAAAEASLALANLKAPISGTVTRVDIKAGDQVTPGTVAMRIDDLSSLYVDVRVSEVDINKIALEQPVTLTFDAILGTEYRGSVSNVSPVGQNVQGIVEFLVTVELDFTNGDVKPGMTAGVNIVINQLENVLLVPNRAVRVQNGQRIVYTLVNGSLETVPVTLGASSDTASEVLEGSLQLGDLVVLNPPLDFSNTGGPPPFVSR